MWVNATTNLLVPDVILNHCERILADRRDEITVRPEIWLPVVLLKDSLPVFPPCEPGSLRLDYVDKTARGSEGIRFEQDVYMVRLSVHLHDHEPLFPEDIPDRAVYDLLNAAGQDRVPVLCHQHHMVLQQEAALKNIS